MLEELQQNNKHIHTKRRERDEVQETVKLVQEKIEIPVRPQSGRLEKQLLQMRSLSYQYDCLEV